MSVALYTDQHVHAAVVAGLRDRSVDVLTARDDGFDQAPDKMLLARATELRRLLFTNDVDLLRIAHEMQASGQVFGGVAFAPQQGMSVGRLIGDLELIAKAMGPQDLLNQVIFLPF